MKLIAISGKKGSGKDTSAQILKTIFRSADKTACIQHLADSLKMVCWKMYKYKLGSLSRIKGTQEEKEAEITTWPIAEAIRARYPFLTSKVYWSGRLLMQYMGTEIYRGVDEDVWVEYLCDDIKLHMPPNMNFVLVPDCRFVNEVEVFRKYFETITIRINRDTGQRDMHSSEVGLPDSHVDIQINNELSMNDLYHELRNKIAERGLV